MKHHQFNHARLAFLAVFIFAALTGCQKELSITDSAANEETADLEKRSVSTGSGCETAFAKPDGNNVQLLDYFNANRWGWMANISLNPNGVQEEAWPFEGSEYSTWPIYAAAGRNVGGYVVGYVKVKIVRKTYTTPTGSKFDVEICFENLLSGYVMEELHIYVGDQPTSVAPGQFTLRKSFSPKTNSPGCYSFTDVKAQAQCDNVWIIIHAVVCKK